MKNLSIFSKHFWPENFKINDVCFKLKNNFKINVFTSEPSYNNIRYKSSYKKDPILNNIKVKYLKTYVRKDNSFFSILLDYISYILKLIFYLRNTSNLKSNVVLTFATSPLLQAIPAIFFSKFKRIPSILWVQDLWPEVLEDTGYIKNKFLLFIINLIVKQIYQNSDLILAQSESFKKHIKKEYKISHNKIHVLHQPSNTKFKKYKKITRKKTIFTFAGNLGEAQDFQTLLNAFLSKNLNENVVLYIIGSGKKYNFIKKFIRKNNLKSKIILKKYISNSKINKYFINSDCLVVTLKDGKSLNKTIPGKFQTYLAYGKPILSSSSGYLNNFISLKKIGFCNKPDDVKKIVKNMNFVCKLSQKEKIKIYFSSKKVYEHYFEINKIVFDLKNFINNLEISHVKKNIL